MSETISLSHLITKREQEVFNLLMNGMPNKEIASLLGISEKTVEEHLTRIYSKIGVTSRSKAILWRITQSGDFPH